MTSSATLERVYALSVEGLDEVDIAARTGIPVSRVGVILDELSAGRAVEAAPFTPVPSAAEPAVGFTWEAPPEGRAGTRRGSPNVRTAVVLDQLRAHPGEWARLPGEHSASMIKGWRTRHGVEARAVKQPSGRCLIYVRWPATS